MDPQNDENALILKSESQLDLRKMGPAFAAARKIPLPDAAVEAKRCWGIVAEHVKAVEANGFSAALAQAGLETIVIPQSQLAALPPAVTITAGVMSDEQWSVTDESGATQLIPWNAVTVIGAAALKSTLIKKFQVKEGPTAAQKAASMAIMMATGLPIPIGPKKQTVQKTVSETETSFLMDLVLKDPARRFRMLADRFNYMCLNERMLSGAMANFKLILSDVAARATSARRGKGTQILLTNQPIVQMGYESLTDLERECRWLSALR